MFGIGVDAYRLSVVILVALGVALRIREYASDRSLWLDESLLALNVLDRPLAQLFGHLSFNQAAPPGFLLVERASVALLGASEYALRLFPLLCGIAALPLFVRFARSLLRPPGALVALALFTVGDGLIYYSTEVKQYSVDVTASLLVYVAALSLRSPRLPRRRQAAWIVAGFVALSLSYAAAFMVAAVLIAMVVPAVLRSRLKRWRAVDVATVLWTLALIGAFAYAAPRVSQILASNEHSYSSGLQFLLDLNGGLSTDLGFPLHGPLRILHFCLPFLAVIGVVALARRRPDYAALVVLPPLLLMVASALHAYPVLARSILFLAPLFAVAVAGAIDPLASVASLAVARPRLAALGVSVAIVAVPAAAAARHVVKPEEREEIKPVLAHLWTNWRTGDALFVSERAQYPLRYYLECRCGDLPEPARDLSWRSAKIPLSRTDQYAPALASRPPRLVVSEAGARRFAEARAVSSLLGRRRVWVLVTSKNAGERGLLTYLSCIGRRTDAFVRRAGTGDFKTAAVYRYDLVDSQLRARNCAQHRGAT